MLEITTLLSITLASASCPSPDVFQLATIVALVAASGIFLFTAGVSAISISILLVQLIISGSTISEIIAALGAAGATATGTESFAIAVATLVALIQQVLGC